MKTKGKITRVGLGNNECNTYALVITQYSFKSISFLLFPNRSQNADAFLVENGSIIMCPKWTQNPQQKLKQGESNMEKLCAIYARTFPKRKEKEL